MFRTLVVRIAPSLCDAVRNLSEKFEVVSECSSLADAHNSIKEDSFDLIFLHAELLDSFTPALAALTREKKLPLIIVIAPNEKFAARAFELQVFDYLVEPIAQERLRGTLERVLQELMTRCADDSERQILALLRKLKQTSGTQDRIVVRSRGRFVLLRSQEIDWIQAEGNYVRVHVGSDSYLEHRYMWTMEKQLDPTRFVRIHRSAIVNLDKVKEIRPWSTGEYIVLMRSGKELTLSRSYRDNLAFLLSPGNKANAPANNGFRRSLQLSAI